MEGLLAGLRLPVRVLSKMVVVWGEDEMARQTDRKDEG